MKYFDGHNDVLLKLLYSKNKNRINDFFNGNDYCHIDLPKIKTSNFIGGFFAIFVSDTEPDNDFFTRMNQPSYDFEIGRAHV